MALTALRAVKVRIETSQAGNSGFTFLELLLVLFIVGLASTVVMFSGSRMQEKTIFNTEARKLYLTVKRARELSILERRETAFKVDKETNRYWLEGGDDRSPNVHTIPEKFIISGDDIIFSPKGNSSGGKIEIDNGKGRRYEVTVDPVLGTPSIKRL